MNSEAYSVEKMCDVLKVSTNAYYTWRRSGGYTKSDTFELKSHIKAIFKKNKSTYGSERVTKELERKGIFYSRSWVAQLMRRMGLRSVLSKKFRITTDSKHKYSISPNLLNREFEVDQLGKVWVSDITYIPHKDKFYYFTSILDLADRKVVGWSLSNTMRTQDTVIPAWNHARSRRDIKPDFIFHSDRGVQYASHQLREILNKNQYVRQSMSRKANCWDNAVAESFFKTLKYEEL